MATGPMAGAGLSQLGNEMSLGSSLTEPFEGFKKVLMAKGIEASGLQGFLNKLGGGSAVPPPTSAPVAPMAPVAPTVAPPVAPVMDMGATGAMESMLHPEVSSTLLTALF